MRNTSPWHKSVTCKNRVPNSFPYPLIRECPTLATVNRVQQHSQLIVSLRLMEEARGFLAVTAQDTPGKDVRLEAAWWGHLDRWRKGKSFLGTDREHPGKTLCYSSPSPIAKGGFGLRREMIEGRIWRRGRTLVQKGGSRQLGAGG